jgi:hypothetical protein
MQGHSYHTLAGSNGTCTASRAMEKHSGDVGLVVRTIRGDGAVTTIPLWESEVNGPPPGPNRSA